MHRSVFRKKRVMSNKKSIFIVIIAISLIAFIVGAFCCKYIGVETADRIYNIFVDTAASKAYMKIITASLVYHLIIYMIILILGMSAIGIPFILLISGYLSFGCGFAIGCLYKFYAFKGVLISSLAMAPGIIISFTLLIVFASIAIDYSFKLFLFYSKGNLQKNDLPKFTSLINKAVVFYTINILAVLYETFISPIFINMIIK